MRCCVVQSQENHHMRVIFVSVLLLISLSSQAQVAIGEWRAHLNYSKAFKAVETDDRIYCATENGLFFVQKEDLSSMALSPVNGLNGVNVVNLAYDPSTEKVIVAYDDGLIDVIEDGSIRLISDIAQSDNIIGEKSINNFWIENSKAYMATDFGVVVYDLIENEIRESYINLNDRGNRLAVLDLAIYRDRLYIASPDGLRSGSLDDNLLDFNFWRTDNPESATLLHAFNDELIVHFANGNTKRFNGNDFSDIPSLGSPVLRQLSTYEGKLHLVKSKNVLIYDANWNLDSFEVNVPSYYLLDADGRHWVCNNIYGLLLYEEGEDVRFIKPNGPSSENCWDLAYGMDEVWVASGGVDAAYNPRFLKTGIYTFQEERWKNYDAQNTPILDPLSDIHLVSVDQVRERRFFASYNAGIVMWDENGELTHYGKEESNGALQSVGNNQDPLAAVRIAGMDLDSQGNLWMTQQYAEDQVVVRTSDNEWYSYNIGSEERVNDILVDNSGYKWIVIHLNGLYVFDDNGTLDNTSDDRVIRLDQNVGRGKLPVPDVYAVELDQDGAVWIGTSDGVAVFYSPDAIFDPEFNSDASRPSFDAGDGAAYLLEGQKVNSITVDGANQKWIGTNNGLFVTNPSGTDIVYHFTKENSPLLSNVVRSIALHAETGEAFIATDAGLISYRAEVSEGAQVHRDVYAFPNPVHPDFSGPITITGLVTDANVKITDISGNLVYETFAKGGTAVWNGKNFGGQEVTTGVYLVFSSNRDGSETFVTKIMFIR